MPLAEVDGSYKKLQPLTITDNELTITAKLGDQEFRIARVRPEEQIEELDEEGDEES